MIKPVPSSRKRNLIVRHVAGEVLIYDLDRDKAFCLNDTAAAVWKLCDGEASPKQMAAALSRQFGEPVQEKLVWYALSQLSRDGLLDAKISLPPSITSVTRREQLRHLGKAAAIGLPFVTSLLTPTAAQGQGSCGAVGAPCDTKADCCASLNCIGNPKRCG